MERLLIVGVLFVTAAATALLLLPRLLVRASLDAEGLERRRLQNEIVRTGAQVLGGAFFLVTAAFTWLELQNSKADLENNQRQLEVAQEGQITERFTRAIDQLGSDKLDVRLGGIYALERIGRDSPKDRGPVLEVLSAFLRERSPVDRASTPDLVKARGLTPAGDIQAAATVLGRRNRENDPRTDQTCSSLGGPSFPCVVTLTGVDLTGADLVGANFDAVDLRGARLTAANLAFASFQRADLSFSDIRGANLRLADLTEASLNNATLEATNLHLTKGLTCEQLRSSRSGPAGAANLTITCS